MPLSCSLNNLEMLGKWKGNVHTHIPIFREKKSGGQTTFLAPFFGEMPIYDIILS